MLARRDAQLLRQVLENLLGNAWKYSSQQDEAHIEFRSSTNSDGETVWAIQNHGAGFEMPCANKLFSPFQRLHADCAFSASGIGPVAVQRIIALQASFGVSPSWVGTACQRPGL